MQLADVSRDIKQERKPAHPVEELDFADFADLGWKSSKGGEDLAEEGDDADLLRRRRAFETGVAFADVKTGDHDCAAKSKGSNNTQDFKLCVTKDSSGKLWKICIAGEVSKNIAKTGDPAGPSVGIFLLMGWSIIYDEGSDAGLDYRSIC